MKQREAVVAVMENNGGYATLGFLNQNVLKIKGCEWKTKTPFASIRRIVQDKRFFFKIRPGLWALKSFRDKLPAEILPERNQPKAKQEEYNHTYYQGLLVEIGNLKRFQTFVPSQDRNKIYLGKKLGDLATVGDFYRFSYDTITQRARTIDVSWFNMRKMPEKVFEVEHSTDIQNSLLKFIELQDFYLNFCIIADEARKREFEAKLSLNAFAPIKRRTNFLSYFQLSDWHTKTYAITSLENSLAL